MYKIKKEEAKQLKNKYIVEKLGYSNTYISMILNGKITCPLHTAYAIASLYDKEVEELFEKVGG